MDENGIKFLDKLYGNLYMSDVVQHTKENSDNRVEAIKKYLDRLEKLHKFADTEVRKEYVLNMYYDKYVIKEENIPYVEDKNQVINVQKEKLAKWISYLTDPTTSYPLWAKYWAFQGMLKMGSYDEVKGVYLKRDKKTIAPFVEPNPEIIAKSITTIMKLVNGEDIDDITEVRLSKTDSFSKIYTAFEKEYKKNVQEKSNSDDGVWIKYNQGDRKAAIKLNKTLENRNTGWCTSNELTAIDQVCGPYSDASKGGDFYVYYTKDADGKYSVPRIAIRCSGHTRIGEIRGIKEGQNLEEELVGVLESKLKSMKFLDADSVEKNLKIVNGLIELSEIASKSRDNIPLTASEIDDLYSKHFGFGWFQEPRVKKILEIRNITEDFELMSPGVKRRMLCTRRLPKSVKVDDEKILRDAIKEEPSAFVYATEQLLSDKDFVKFALTEGAKRDSAAHLSDFELISKELRADKEIVMLMTDNNSHALQYASDELRADEEVINHAILRRQSPSILDSREAFMYADDKFKSDRDYVLKMSREHNVQLLQFVTEEVRKDKEVVIDAIKRDPHQFIFISEELKTKDFILELLAKENVSSRILFEIPEKLRNDERIAMCVLANAEENDLDWIYRRLPTKLREQPIMKLTYYNTKRKNEEERKRRASIPEVLKEIGESKIKKEK